MIDSAAYMLIKIRLPVVAQHSTEPQYHSQFKCPNHHALLQAQSAQSTSIYSAVQDEVYWGIRKYCQCKYNYFQHIFLNNGYFTCAAGGYVTFRANLYSTEVTANPADLKIALTTWLHGQDTDKTIAIYRMQYPNPNPKYNISC